MKKWFCQVANWFRLELLIGMGKCSVILSMCFFFLSGVLVLGNVEAAQALSIIAIIVGGVGIAFLILESLLFRAIPAVLHEISIYPQAYKELKSKGWLK